MHKCRVVITGVGLATPLGKDVDEIWNNLISSVNGISNIENEYGELEQYGVHIAGLFPDIELDLSKMCDSLGKKGNYRRFNKRDRVLLYCALKAVMSSGLQQNEMKKMGGILGTSLDFTDIFEEDTVPTKFFNSYPNILISHLAQFIPFENHAITIVNACCSGLQAMGEGFQKIRNGEEKIVLAGGIDDKLNAYCAKGFSRLGMISKSKDRNKAMRPFDKERDGFVMGQGCAMFILEEYEHALERKSDILGEIVGYGNSIDATSVADASVKGKQEAMQKAIEDAGISYGDIGYINAHGTSTISNDRAENTAIYKVFKEHTKNIIVNSTKSYIGHTFAACGPIQSFVCMKSLSTNRTHGNSNFQQADADNMLTIPKECIELLGTEYCMTNTSAIGGINTSLVFKKTDGK